MITPPILNLTCFPSTARFWAIICQDAGQIGFPNPRLIWGLRRKLVQDSSQYAAVVKSTNVLLINCGHTHVNMFNLLSWFNHSFRACVVVPDAFSSASNFKGALFLIRLLTEFKFMYKYTSKQFISTMLPFAYFMNINARTPALCLSHKNTSSEFRTIDSDWTIPSSYSSLITNPFYWTVPDRLSDRGELFAFCLHRKTSKLGWWSYTFG